MTAQKLIKLSSKLSAPENTAYLWLHLTMMMYPETTSWLTEAKSDRTYVSIDLKIPNKLKYWSCLDNMH